jgi:hypothetical protein
MNNQELCIQNPKKYELMFKEVKKRRKKERSDKNQPLMIAEQEAKVKRNLRKMQRKKNAIVFKGKPLVFRARKKKIVKKEEGIKRSQADMDYERYVGLIEDD